MKRSFLAVLLFLVFAGPVLAGICAPTGAVFTVKPGILLNNACAAGSCLKITVRTMKDRFSDAVQTVTTYPVVPVSSMTHDPNNTLSIKFATAGPFDLLYNPKYIGMAGIPCVENFGLAMSISDRSGLIFQPLGFNITTLHTYQSAGNEHVLFGQYFRSTSTFFLSNQYNTTVTYPESYIDIGISIEGIYTPVAAGPEIEAVIPSIFASNILLLYGHGFTPQDMITLNGSPASVMQYLSPKLWVVIPDNNSQSGPHHITLTNSAGTTQQSTIPYGLPSFLPLFYNNSN